MKQKIIARGGWMLALFALLTLPLCSCAVKEPEVKEKEIVKTLGGLIAAYSFDEAVDKAEYVVYGTVVEKGKPVEIVYDVSPYGVKYTGCYRVVTVEVIECAKGGLRAGDAVTYCEWGGETRDQIYQYDDTQEVEKGDTVLVFVKGGHYIGPDWLWILDSEEDATIPMQDWRLPPNVTADSDHRVSAVPLRSLLDAARALADELDATPSDDAASSRGENQGRNAV